ncbi:hypothetical protein Fuma_00638 [Fuerstiella marisgermanici]|uniref:Uncharacterized protein n=1 Tax=Fuerstiella marisgermanici TaxID=1891926 RepID=A0A1P8WAJ9_9PLAN|nr:hypothetical protein Fuma_00638 [Fuerstiella marisgermanici]
MSWNSSKITDTTCFNPQPRAQAVPSRVFMSWQLPLQFHSLQRHLCLRLPVKRLAADTLRKAFEMTGKKKWFALGCLPIAIGAAVMLGGAVQQARNAAKKTADK